LAQDGVDLGEPQEFREFTLADARLLGPRCIYAFMFKEPAPRRALYDSLYLRATVGAGRVATPLCVTDIEIKPCVEFSERADALTAGARQPMARAAFDSSQRSGSRTGINRRRPFRTTRSSCITCCSRKSTLHPIERAASAFVSASLGTSAAVLAVGTGQHSQYSAVTNGGFPRGCPSTTLPSRDRGWTNSDGAGEFALCEEATLSQPHSLTATDGGPGLADEEDSG
jgi:hypothetical protein